MKKSTLPLQRPSAEWRPGWRVVVSAFVGSTLAAMAFFAQGVFMVPLGDEFGWTRTQVSASGMVFSMVSALSLPFVGQAVAKFGARRLVLSGWVIGIGAFVSLSLVNGNLLVFYLLWMFIGAGVAMAGSVSLSVGVVSWFVRHRGSAVAIALTGTNVIGAAIPFAAAALIASFGWRTAYLVLGTTAFAMCYPLLAAWFAEKDSTSATPDDVSPESADAGRDYREGEYLRLRDVCRTRRFWIFGVAIALIGIGLVAQVVHFIPFMTDRGFSPEIAAGALGANSLVACLCGVACGFLLDRYSIHILSPIFFFCPAAAAFLLASETGGIGIAIFAAGLLGVCSGVVMPVMSVFVTRYFGTANYGPIFALLMSMFVICQGVGTVIVGAIYDASGTYTLAFTAVGIGTLAGAAAIATIGRPPAAAGRTAPP